MEKMRQIILLALVLVIFFNGSALGAVLSYKCVIHEVGIKSNGQVLVELSELNGAFNKEWFLCTQNVSKQMLAILLTASANDMVVRIWADLQTGPEPEITNLSILP